MSKKKNISKSRNKNSRKSRAEIKKMKKNLKGKEIEVGDVYKTKDKYMYIASDKNAKKRFKKGEKMRPVTVINNKKSVNEITIARLTTKQKKIDDTTSPKRIKTTIKNKGDLKAKATYIKMEGKNTNVVTGKKFTKDNFDPKEKDLKNIDDNKVFIDYSGRIDKRKIRKIKKD